MPIEIFTNAATTTLNGTITSGATSLVVTSSSLFPAAASASATQFRIMVEQELMIVTNVSGTTWTVTRGAEGTTAAGHTSGVNIVHIVTAAEFNLFTQTVQAWTTYTPALTAVTTNPTNVTSAGRWFQIDKQVTFAALFTFTATSTTGTGSYNCSLPVPAVSGNIGQAIPSGCRYNSGSTNNFGGCYLQTTTTVRLMQSAGAVTPTSPFAWANGDTISVAGVYEAA